MILLTCPNCQVRINAKDSLAGQTRACPRCGGELHIPVLTPAVSNAQAVQPEPQPDQRTDDILGHDIAQIEYPERLARHNRYLVLDHARLIAVWESDLQGWQLKTTAGYINLVRNMDKVPNQGRFTLVELKLIADGTTVRLHGLQCYALAERYALSSLEDGQDKILTKITGPGALDRQQKGLVRQYLRDRFMHQVWAEAREVLDFLGNADHHSSKVG
jgi:hypothetical protein